MKKHLYLSIIVFVLLSLAGWTGYARGQRTVGRQTWEYRVDLIPSTDFGSPREIAASNAESAERLINRRATEGWELAAVGGANFYFRRAKL